MRACWRVCSDFRGGQAGEGAMCWGISLGWAAARVCGGPSTAKERDSSKLCSRVAAGYCATTHGSVEPVGAKVLYWQAFSGVSSTMSMDCFSGLPVLPVVM